MITHSWPHDYPQLASWLPPAGLHCSDHCQVSQLASWLPTDGLMITPQLASWLPTAGLMITNSWTPLLWSLPSVTAGLMISRSLVGLVLEVMWTGNFQCHARCERHCVYNVGQLGYKSLLWFTIKLSFKIVQKIWAQECFRTNSLM